MKKKIKHETELSKVWKKRVLPTNSLVFQLGQEGIVPLKSARLFFDLSEKVRKILETYFHLTTPLYFSYSHLVCRSAIEGECECPLLEGCETDYWYQAMFPHSSKLLSELIKHCVLIIIANDHIFPFPEYIIYGWSLDSISSSKHESKTLIEMLFIVL